MNTITVTINLEDLSLLQLAKLGDVLTTVSDTDIEPVVARIEKLLSTEAKKLAPEQYAELYLLVSDILGSRR